MHVRQVRAERAVHDPAQPRQRRRSWADEQLLPRAGQQVGMWLLFTRPILPDGPDGHITTAVLAYNLRRVGI